MLLKISLKLARPFQTDIPSQTVLCVIQDSYKIWSTGYKEQKLTWVKKEIKALYDSGMLWVENSTLVQLLKWFRRNSIGEEKFCFFGECLYFFSWESNLLKDQRKPANSESDLIAFLLTDFILHFIRSPMYLVELYCILSSPISLS